MLLRMYRFLIVTFFSSSSSSSIRILKFQVCVHFPFRSDIFLKRLYRNVILKNMLITSVYSNVEINAHSIMENYVNLSSLRDRTSFILLLSDNRVGRVNKKTRSLIFILFLFSKCPFEYRRVCKSLISSIVCVC